ncbi:bifunctional diaminohydroxyphosphoribosylaminopyrimidine deaminase/5-amino-6-(5-phosphoribosylamino)uracil reductase RibD [bacterium]|nr:bifunctional diaminohydroxyphosphoribosylaminopyrimidine deaminase/5-amino-6-(5-phosphoribosylamino)uracil reductase RibD [bacterium]
MSEIPENIVIEMMKLAVGLSKKATVKTYPNPKVGAVIFDDSGKIISEGWTQEYGSDHAEADALRKIGFKAQDLNMAVTLEPCNHYGKTPPCSKAIFEAGIRRVFVAKEEENKKASGGIAFLRQNGVETFVVKGFADDIEEINRFFFKGVRTNLPWVTAKVALSSDGFITDKPGERCIITGFEAQKHVHQLRSEHSAIAVGANTVNIDDPLLTVRLIEGFDPQPVIFSRNFSVDLNAQIMKRSPIIITSSQKVHEIKAQGIKPIILENGFSLKEALTQLFTGHKINSILLEGGANLVKAFLKEGLIDEMQLIISEKTFGCGLPLFNEETKKIFENSFHLTHSEKLGEDTLKIYRLK